MLEIRVGPPRDALDRFEAAWNRLAEGGSVRTLRVLTLEDLPAFAKALTPARWALLEDLKKNGPCSVYELARRLGRDYKNVHTDVASLEKLTVIQRVENHVTVGWDMIRAEMRF